MTRPVYISALGAFLPGEAVSNDEMEEFIGVVGGAKRMKDRVLKQNGIRSRYYAMDRDGQSTHRNSEMAALAITDALEHSRFSKEDLELLAVGTTQGDLLVPGFASMVHGELGNPSCEVVSHHGVCCSGVMALKSAYLQIKAGEKRTATACASELISRVFKRSRYEGQSRVAGGQRLTFDTEFLRWMLSDAAGAAILSHEPNPRGLSLRIEWIESKSFADRYDTCMYAGATKNRAGELGTTWLDYPSYEAAAIAGVMNLKQDTRMLDDLVKVGVDYFFELIEAGRVRAEEIDWFVGHYSSHVFRGKILTLLERAGISLPEEKWFTNLYTKGNTGAASIFVLLEELFNEGPIEAGDRILCMVPESGRFTISYFLLTVVGAGEDGSLITEKPQSSSESEEITAPVLNIGGDPLRQSLVRRLARVWIDFEARLRQVPIIDKLERGRFTREDYRLLLFNQRQQVVEGARWIARAASNIDAARFPLRSIFIGHAGDEHRDFQMIERNYVAVGGKLEDIQAGEKNIGSEALSAWMFHRSSQPNPFDLLGAMFIIEGLGTKVARRWGESIRDQLELDEESVSFLLYHADNDGDHFGRLETALGADFLDQELVDAIVKSAKVTARLYRLQLEEIGRC